MLRLLHNNYPSNIPEILLYPADITGIETRNSTAKKSCRSRQSLLVPCLDCYAPTGGNRKGKENQKKDEALDTVTIEVAALVTLYFCLYYCSSAPLVLTARKLC